MLDPREFIRAKRDRRVHTATDLREFIAAYLRREIPDYQVSAWLMAAYLNGLDESETEALTLALLHSGRTFDWKDLGRPSADKHSTGGVGDKVSLILAPLVAACGVLVPMVSGRGLGHTGGTLDKLESIPGFKVQLPQGEFLRQLERIGVAVVSQSERLVPADRILYALRDVTGTVEDDGLIAASIMSKKVASGTSALVLDIKIGRGAFLKDLEHARDLARRCRLIGDAFERRVSCLFTAMDAPLGLAVGNRIEVEEAWDVLKGDGPSDVREVSLSIAGMLLALSDVGVDEAEGRRRAEAAIADGRAAAHFERWCYVQGGTWKPGEYHRLAGCEARAPRGGFVAAVDALAVGQAAQLAGAGRRTVDDQIDLAAGVVLARVVGDEVAAGDLLATVHARDAGRRERAAAVLETAFTLADERPLMGDVVLGRG